MSEHGQVLVDVEILDHDSAAAKRRLTDWLVQRHIVVPETSDCVLGQQGGHAPGNHYGHAVGFEGAARPAYALNGLEIVTGRHVYWGTDLEAVICPRCAHREEMAPGEHSRWDSAFNDAINEWLAGATGAVGCLRCGAWNALNDWDWSPAWAFGALGLTVWNWEALSTEFVSEVSEVLGGHRIVCCSFKL